MDDEKANTDKSLPRKRKTKKPPQTLKPSYRVAIEAYTNPDLPTFGNKSRTGILAFNTNSPITGAQGTNRVLSNPLAQELIEQRLSKLGLGREIRLTSLAEVAAGVRKRKITTKTSGINAKGQEVDLLTETVSEPSGSEIARANDVLSKIDGTYDKSKAQREVMTDAMKSLIKRMGRNIQTKNENKSKSSESTEQ